MTLESIFFNCKIKELSVLEVLTVVSETDRIMQILLLLLLGHLLIPPFWQCPPENVSYRMLLIVSHTVKCPDYKDLVS